MMLLRSLRANFCLIRLPGLFHGYVFCSTSVSNNTVKYLCKYLNITSSKAHLTCLKHPSITKLDEFKICEIVETMTSLGFSKREIANEPVLFSFLSVTLHYRYKVLQECGFSNINVKHIATYLHLMKKNTIKQLKSSGFIISTLNVENKLASFMTDWPTSLTTFINGDIEEHTLYELRLNIIQRYLEFIIDLSEDEFKRGIATYPNIKHRPLQAICEVVSLLTSTIMMPHHKVKSNLYLVHADVDNLKQIIYNVRSIAGVDVKEILRMYPKLCCVSYKNIIATRKVLQEYDVSNEAQSRCFEIFTLAPETVRERLENAKKLPEFEPLYHHPRFLKIIYYRNTAAKRMLNLYSMNKKCVSLNILFGGDLQYKSFAKKPGDKSGKGNDLLFCLVQIFGKGYSSKTIGNAIRRHPFWMNVSVAHVTFVHAKLVKEFSPKDIYENCPILLYPWNRIKEGLKLHQSSGLCRKCDNINDTNLTNSQVLSLVLYYLEKDHYFTGNGIWVEEKFKIQAQNLVHKSAQTC